MSKRVALWWVAACVGLSFLSFAPGCSEDDKDKTTDPGPSPTTPIPKFTAVTVSPSFGNILLGESFTIVAQVRNEGLDSDSGMISISFPGLADSTDATTVRSLSGGDDPGHQITLADSILVDQGCQPKPAEYLLAQYTDTQWRQGEANTYTLQITPLRAGNYQFLVRSALRLTGESCEYVEAVPEGGQATVTDQQGWTAARFAMRVVGSVDSMSGDQQKRIEPGNFPMGSLPGELGRATNEEYHRVTLTYPFFLQAHEVSQTEWETVMGWDYSLNRGPWRPVENITWYDALNYCNERSKGEGLTPVYDFKITLADSFEVLIPRQDQPDSVYYPYINTILGIDSLFWHMDADGYRLPTEAEWEYACRAGSAAALPNGPLTELLCNPVDPRLDEIAWYCGNSGGQATGQSHDVALKAPNPWGLHDMNGNIREWCWDYWGEYPRIGGDESVIDPTAPGTPADTIDVRVARGGSWNSVPKLCRSAARRGVLAAGKSDDLGLRVARNAR